MAERFIGESLTPADGVFDAGRMSIGRPGLPGAFDWRGRRIRIVRVLREWSATGPCRHGGGEQYVRKHWFEAEDQDGRRLTIYFERQPRGRSKTDRWHLFTLRDPAPAAPGVESRRLGKP